MNPGQDKIGDVNQSSEAHDKKNGSINETKKSDGETYGNKLIYSPYLAPSHLIIEQKQAISAEGLTYMHNVAKTKYHMISRAEKPSDHTKVNLLL